MPCAIFHQARIELEHRRTLLAQGEFGGRARAAQRRGHRARDRHLAQARALQPLQDVLGRLDPPLALALQDDLDVVGEAADGVEAVTLTESLNPDVLLLDEPFGALDAKVRKELRRWLRRLHDDSGRKVSLVGWSLGGVYARLLATQYPELVRSVITLGSPFTGSPRATNAWRVYEGVSGERADDHQRWQYVRPKPPVPTTSIYSRTDGVVAWRCSLEAEGPQAENIEVIASHIGLGGHPAVLYAVADRLAQPEGVFKHFDRSGPFAIAYAPPEKCTILTSCPHPRGLPERKKRRQGAALSSSEETHG